MLNPIDSYHCSRAMSAGMAVKIDGLVFEIVGYLKELFYLFFRRYTRVRQRDAKESHSCLFDRLLFSRYTTSFQVDYSFYSKRFQIRVIIPYRLRPAIQVLIDSPKVLYPISC